MECIYHGKFSNFELGFINSFAEIIPLALLYNKKAIPLPNKWEAEKKKMEFI